ncbi:hypothetical protein SSBR45G_57820 [Bradyrhizobium sp. SSBR45G]|nr:hypothetical protein SSBR45G_57820 [Bradyrhizobium sp. SSBR45G]GLH88345.1 hypothetical protein SSBR45R_58060 [Bradyrhizobium sp. SSBR45R]
MSRTCPLLRAARLKAANTAVIPRESGVPVRRGGAVDHSRRGVLGRPVESGDDSGGVDGPLDLIVSAVATHFAELMPRNPAVTRPRDHSWPNNRFRSLPKTIMVPDHVAAGRFRFRIQSTGYGLVTQVRRAV